MGSYAALIACSVLVALVVYLLLEIRLRRSELLLERQQKQIDSLLANQAAASHSGTQRHERRGGEAALVPKESTPRSTARLEPSPPRGTARVEPSPRGTARLEPSPRGTARLEPSPRGTPRLEPSPRGTPRLEPSRSAMARLEPNRLVPRTEVLPRAAKGMPEVAAPGRGGAWAASHRISFHASSGRTESWLVMMLAAPDGGRIATTKQEWTAGVAPAWRCDVSGAWTHHGLATPDSAPGKLSLEEFTLS